MSAGTFIAFCCQVVDTTLALEPQLNDNGPSVVVGCPSEFFTPNQLNIGKCHNKTRCKFDSHENNAKQLLKQPNSSQTIPKPCHYRWRRTTRGFLEEGVLEKHATCQIKWWHMSFTHRSMVANYNTCDVGWWCNWRHWFL